ncbi:Protein of unknown function [Pyronema omphalodes CBS 100304]|uniref:Uncharacterized protein n=1 Tax=Pyronema omphalodes (strain CBS 100304) TaxID=1076935 RepID=U4L0X0_PYROM|nr:Protein of unknown function [Pyronema omphalodes CBS 100304]
MFLELSHGLLAPSVADTMFMFHTFLHDESTCFPPSFLASSRLGGALRETSDHHGGTKDLAAPGLFLIAWPRASADGLMKRRRDPGAACFDLESVSERT